MSRKPSLLSPTAAVVAVSAFLCLAALSPARAQWSDSGWSIDTMYSYKSLTSGSPGAADYTYTTGGSPFVYAYQGQVSAIASATGGFRRS